MRRVDATLIKNKERKNDLWGLKINSTIKWKYLTVGEEASKMNFGE